MIKVDEWESAGEPIKAFDRLRDVLEKELTRTEEAARAYAEELVRKNIEWTLRAVFKGNNRIAFFEFHPQGLNVCISECGHTTVSWSAFASPVVLVPKESIDTIEKEFAKIVARLRKNHKDYEEEEQ